MYEVRKMSICIDCKYWEDDRKYDYGVCHRPIGVICPCKEKCTEKYEKTRVPINGGSEK